MPRQCDHKHRHHARWRALMVLPSLIVGNELLILAGVAAAVGLWFFAHRHGQLRGLVDAAEAAVVTPPDNSGKVGGA